MPIDVRAARAYLEAREQQQLHEREARRERAAQAARAAVRAVMPYFPSVAKAYLFGSVTRPGAMRRDSDIDIAIEGHLTAEEYFALWRDLERAMPGW
jgi:predicted nucleotidyltransferase